MVSCLTFGMRRQFGVRNRQQKRRKHTKSTTSSPGLSAVNSSLSDQGSESESIFFVEDIIGEKSVKGRKYYKVRWQGFPPESDSWEPEENLSNVIDLIVAFRQRTNSMQKDSGSMKDNIPGMAGSPASVPTPSSSFSCPVVSTSERQRGVSEERSDTSSSKRRCTGRSRISGRYEYVPKSELVASKTKYFDDIRDGKIDLSSNDLYSRVKTRRRLTDTSAKETSSESVCSVSRGIVASRSDSNISMEKTASSSLKNEPNSPLSECFQSIFDSLEFEQSKRSLNEELKSFTQSLSGPLFSTPRSPTKQYHDKAIQVEHLIPNLSVPITTTLHYSGLMSPVQLVDAAVSPLNLSGSSFDIDREDTSIQTSTVPPVTSLRALVQCYFNIISMSQQQYASMGDSKFNLLDSLPKLEPYGISSDIVSRSDILALIASRNWPFIAKAPTKCLLSPPEPPRRSSSERKKPVVYLDDVFKSVVEEQGDTLEKLCTLELVAECAIHQTSDPFAIQKLLCCGLDPDAEVRNINDWPLLAMAVYLGRIHIAQALLDAGAYPDCVVPGVPMRSALGLAICNGDVDMATMLILSGANFYEVEPNTTALNLISRLWHAHQSSRNYNPPGSARSPAGLFPPVPHPSSSVSVEPLPRPRLLAAMLTPSSSGRVSTSTTEPLFPSPYREELPPMESLNHLHDLISVHHARLSGNVNETVRTWLGRAGLIQVGLVYPYRWINTGKSQTIIRFSWPCPNAIKLPVVTAGSYIVPVLLLIHGRITPPACYNLWMSEEEGLCVVKQVRLDDVIQKPLDSKMFASTLFPVCLDLQGTPREHKITVDFQPSIKSHRFCLGHPRPVCIAISVVAVCIDAMQAATQINQGHA